MVTNCIKTYPLSLLTVLAVIALSVMPFPEIKMAENIPFVDKWVHFVMYGGVAFIIWIELARREKKKSNRKTLMQLLVWGLLFPTLLGGVLELIQEYLTTTRSGEWLDFFADTFGAVLGALAGAGIRAWLLRNLPTACRDTYACGSCRNDGRL